jgi:DNA polymerase-3 subunit delta'
MIAGLQKQWQVLRNMAEAGKIPHALLFSGPEKTGKKTLALEFAKFIFCRETAKGLAPCCACRSCSDVDNKIHPDLSLVLPEEGSIKIAQIRDLTWRLSLKPYSAKIKVGIIDDAHLIQFDAQNSLLKTLEEPKGDTLLILVTSNPQMLLRTISSRVQTSKFSLAGQGDIEKFLLGLGADEKKAGEIAGLSSGRPGLAMDFFKDPEKLAVRRSAMEEIKSVIKAGIPQRFNYAKKIADSPETINEILGLWEDYFRKIVISDPKVGVGLLKSVKSLEETAYLIKTTNVNQKLALENLMLNLNIR